MGYGMGYAWVTQKGDAAVNLQSFKAHIKTVPHSTLDAYHEELSQKLRQSRTPARRLGYSLALDELVIEAEMRRTGRGSAPDAVMSDAELLAALGA